LLIRYGAATELDLLEAPVQTRKLNFRHAVGFTIAGLVLGLAAPAAAGQAKSIAHKISGSQIKKHSIAGNRLKNGTVTGKQVKESSLRMPLTWVPLTLAAGWSEGRSTRTASVAIDASGIVHLKGAVTCANPCSSSTFTTLPELFRPETAVDIPIYTSTENIGEVYIQPSGDVTVYDLAGSTAGSAESFTSLDGITYALR
jgi:hypothetical protein